MPHHPPRSHHDPDLISARRGCELARAATSLMRVPASEELRVHRPVLGGFSSPKTMPSSIRSRDCTISPAFIRHVIHRRSLPRRCLVSERIVSCWIILPLRLLPTTLLCTRLCVISGRDSNAYTQDRHRARWTSCGVSMSKLAPAASSVTSSLPPLIGPHHRSAAFMSSLSILDRFPVDQVSSGPAPILTADSDHDGNMPGGVIAAAQHQSS